MSPAILPETLRYYIAYDEVVQIENEMTFRGLYENRIIAVSENNEDWKRN